MKVPLPAGRTGRIAGSVYSHLVAALASYEGETYPFHVGDTWLRPPPGAAAESIGEVVGGMNRYTPVAGWGPLREAVAARVARRSGVPTTVEDVFICAGATAGLAAVLHAMVGDGDEVIVLAPAWPLLANTVSLVGGQPVMVDFHGRALTTAEVAALLRAHLTPRTVAIYVNTPSNPTGRAVEADALAAIAHVARAAGVWVIADEVYEDHRFDAAHTPMRALAPERTISAHSFSKAYGMAGYRVGYVVGPSSFIAEAAKVSTYTYYCAPFPGQVAALAALSDAGDAWLAEARAAYAAIGAQVAATLGVAAPQGGTFLFLDVADALDTDGLDGFLRRCAARGLLVAGGPAFGPYPHHVRLCFTATPPEVTARGVEVLADVLGRPAGG